MQSKMRYRLSKTCRITLGIIMLAALIACLVTAYIGAIDNGDFSVFTDLSTTFFLIITILIFVSKEHSESVIFGLILPALLMLITGLIGGRFAWRHLVTLAFAAFIITSLFVKMNKAVVKIVSLAFIVFVAYFAYCSTYNLIAYEADAVMIINNASRYIMQIIPALVFVLAVYEESEEKDFAKTICLTGIASTLALGAKHFLLFIGAQTLLEGHQYGAPDIYGDYKTGLYSSEVQALNGFIPNMILLVVLMILIRVACTLICKKQLALTEEEKKGLKKIDMYSFFSVLLAVIIVCVIGTIITAVHYSMFN